jgi:hypothetical protein
VDVPHAGAVDVAPPLDVFAAPVDDRPLGRRRVHKQDARVHSAQSGADDVHEQGDVVGDVEPKGKGGKGKE